MGFNRHPPFAAPGDRDFASAIEGAEPGLPSIQDFVDDLPAIEDFLLMKPVPTAPTAAPEPEWATEADYQAEMEAEDSGATDGGYASGIDLEEAWAQSSWQSFDWSSAQALGPEGKGAAEASWPDTGWPLADPAQAQPPSAEEVAQLLDGIAYRIRTGQLAIDTTQGTPPEAATAAALAVLLRIRS